ncbi:ABC transporter permease [Streptomyces agglomeratus]|uniref:ABC transporter permease n=1 Tax=Streptomyces agglomeratus TaxID=285458 RepID=UPI000854C769|nr:ABC transporter permease [Streptomyces agglomeratus]OEJ38632.1 ABC transporter permease [Streptomyces agglomeratus]OEJ49211.1 ABC transporter permease [Streptomyces agglomeratus]
MTAPLTPPHHQPPNDPWQKSDAGAPDARPPSGPHAGTGARSDAGAADGSAAPGGPEDRTPVSTEVIRAAVVVLALTALGVALGLLWMWLAPRVPLIATDKAVFLKDTEGEEAVGADGTFVLLALGFGAVSAALVFWFNRRGGIPLVIGLALGGLLGSMLAWGTGVWFGPTGDVVARAREVGQGVPFDAPLKLGAKGALLAWPMAALLVHLGLTALFGPRDPEPEWGVGYGDPAPTPGAGSGARDGTQG